MQRNRLVEQDGRRLRHVVRLSGVAARRQEQGLRRSRQNDAAVLAWREI
jgi:hypothetical protein